MFSECVSSRCCGFLARKNICRWSKHILNKRGYGYCLQCSLSRTERRGVKEDMKYPEWMGEKGGGEKNELR